VAAQEVVVVAAVDLVRRVTRRFGVDVVRYRKVPPDFTRDDAALLKLVRGYTMTSPERIYALVQAVRWLVDERVPGEFVECGVWRGGSMMAVAKALREAGVDDRELYLFDTFEGMTAPTAADRDFRGRRADVTFRRSRRSANSSDWCRATLDEVRANLARTGYPPHRLHYVKGSVEDTVPDAAPDRIALLRLDTDWYESTKHELVHLWPRLVPGGVCIIDDYGYWKGSRQAVDEYLAEHGIRVLMHRLDHTGRLIVKPGP
jgi:predicted O-methyltransferase YrrM